MKLIRYSITYGSLTLMAPTRTALRRHCKELCLPTPLNGMIESVELRSYETKRKIKARIRKARAMAQAVS